MQRPRRPAHQARARIVGAANADIHDGNPDRCKHFDLRVHHRGCGPEW